MRRKSRAEDVVRRIRKIIRNPNLQDKLINNVNDLSLQESRILYDNVDYGDETKLTKKRKLDIGWTDHAEYRSELRNIAPDKLNNMITEKIRTKFLKNPSDRGKVKFKGPEGVAVVDYNTRSNPADATIVTTWASTIKRIASKIEKDFLTAQIEKEMK